MPTSDQIRDIAQRYAEAVSGADPETILACFSGDAEVTDPYPGPSVIGHDGIREFWGRVLSMGTPKLFRIEHISVCDDSAAFLFDLTVSVGDSLLGVKGIDVIQVDDDGLIVSLTAYWEPSSMAPVAAGEPESGSAAAE